MNKYICKCGKVIEKSTNAASTGNRLENYGPGHECYNCPFVIPFREYGGGGVQIVGYECRTSKRIDYTTFADLKLGTNLTGKIRSLDLEFLKEIRAYADTIDGIEKDRYAFSARAADYGADGRYTLTITTKPNKTGQEAKKKLFEAYFDENGRRLDMAPQAEEDHIKSQIWDRIQEVKLAMVEMNEATDFEADENLEEETEEQIELSEPEKEIVEDVLEQIEEVPDEEEPAPMQIAGRRVSILNREFETVVRKIDDVLNCALYIAVDARQGFSLNTKISLTPSNPAPRFTVSYNVGYKFSPIKVEDKGDLFEDIAIGYDADGNLIIPDGSSTQITMDEIAAGVTVTTDQDGVVEEVEIDGEPDSEPEILPGDAEGDEQDPYPCVKLDCWMNDDEKGCCRLDQYGNNEPRMTLDSDYQDAVIDFCCTRKCVLDRYNKIKGGDQDD